MKILCELGRFKETVSRGRFAGNETEYSISVGGDNYSWNLCQLNLNSNHPPIGQKYCKGFCNLLKYLAEYNIPVKDAVSKIISALEKNTGISFELVSSDFHKLTDLEAMGKFIDNHFSCNYNKAEHDSGKQSDPNRIYVRVLKANLKSTEKEDD